VVEIPRKSLSEIVAGKIAGQILDGTYQSGFQLPAERDLIKLFGISRSTLREALKSLEEINLIESRHGVGRFVAELSESNLAQASKIANQGKAELEGANSLYAVGNSPEGPRFPPVTPA